MTAAGFTQAQKDGLVFRDAVCMMTGASPCDGTLVANHRLGRGMGGSKARNGMGNACLLCWRHNDSIERDPADATEARRRGVKLVQGDDPETVPMWHPFFRQMSQPRDTELALLGQPYTPRENVS